MDMAKSRLRCKFRLTDLHVYWLSPQDQQNYVMNNEGFLYTVRAVVLQVARVVTCQ